MQPSFECAQRGVRQLAFSRDGRLIAIDTDWQVWERAGSGGDFSLLGTPPGAMENKNKFCQFAVSPEGRRVAVFGGGGTQVFRLPAVQEVRRLPAPGPHHSVGFASENRLYIGSSILDRYEVFDIDRDTPVMLPTNGETTAAFSDNLAAVICQNKANGLFSTARHPGVTVLPLPAETSAGVLSRDGRTAVVAGRDGLVRIFDAEAGSCKATLDAGHTIKALAVDNATSHLVAVANIETLNDMHCVVQFWNLQKSVKSAEFEEKGSVGALALGHNGNVALSYTGRHAIHLWTRAGEKWAATILATESAVTDFCFAANDSSFLASRSLGIEWWDLYPRPQRRVVLAGSRGFVGASFAANGERIVARNPGTNSIGTWSVKHCDQPPVVFPLAKSPSAVATSDGSEIACSDGFNLQLVDVESQQLLRRFSTIVVDGRVLSLSGSGRRALVTQDRSGAAIFDFPGLNSN
jgi:WD40 repeat protein